jgi:hypothetical protein
LYYRQSHNGVYALRRKRTPIHPEERVNVNMNEKKIHAPAAVPPTSSASVSNLKFMGSKNNANRKLSNPNNRIMENEFKACFY